MKDYFHAHGVCAASLLLLLPFLISCGSRGASGNTQAAAAPPNGKELGLQEQNYRSRPSPFCKEDRERIVGHFGMESKTGNRIKGEAS